MSELAPYAVVALTADLPDFGLSRGQMGTVVASLSEDVFEVEFSAETGETFAIVPVEASKLIRLHREVSDAA